MTEQEPAYYQPIIPQGHHENANPAYNVNVPHMITCAALKDQSGNIYPGIRHFDEIMIRQITRNNTNPPEYSWFQQGFLDNHGQFKTREEALQIALAANQIRRRVGGDTTQLFSENLY